MNNAQSDPRYEPSYVLAKYPTMRDLMGGALRELRRFYPQAKFQIELAPGLVVDVVEEAGGREVDPNGLTAR